MDLSFYPLTLEAIDQAAAESLCLFIASDERPLTGLAGLADWRLSGKLSRLLRSGLLTGEAGEAVLTPPGARLGFQKLFLFGVGPSDQSDDKLAGRVAEALRKLAHAGVQETAMQLPARLPADAGIRALLAELQGPSRAMLFAADPQELIAALSQAAARGQAAHIERRVVKVPPPPAPPPVRRPTPTSVQPVTQTPPAIPKASPLPFAPQGDLARPTPTAIPKASPLPAAPVAEPLPSGPGEPPPVAPAVPASEPPPPEAAPEAGAAEKRPSPPPPQRYVPPPPKPHVFSKKKKP